MDRIILHTNWTNTVQQVTTLALDDLLDGARRDFLRAAFTDPDRLRPSKTRDALTAEAAAKFSELAQRLRARGHDAQAVAHFINRLVFCMFAEDVNLLPESSSRRCSTLRARTRQASPPTPPSSSPPCAPAATSASPASTGSTAACSTTTPRCRSIAPTSST